MSEVISPRLYWTMKIKRFILRILKLPFILAFFQYGSLNTFAENIGIQRESFTFC